jgi:hypothetical protein
MHVDKFTAREKVYLAREIWIKRRGKKQKGK